MPLGCGATTRTTSGAWATLSVRRASALKRRGLLLAAWLAIIAGGCVTPPVTATPLPVATATTTATVAMATAAAAAPTPTPPVPPTTAVTVDVCGSLVRYAADGGQKLLSVNRQGTVTQYRLETGRGTAPDDLGSANQTPFLIRLTGSRVPPDTGSPQATNLANYAVTRVTSCP